MINLFDPSGVALNERITDKTVRFSLFALSSLLSENHKKVRCDPAGVGKHWD